MDVEEAIARARGGDLAAYETVVRDFQGALVTWIAAWCPDRNQVDEVAQRAFVWAFQHLDRYEPGTRFRAWLREIARNLLLADLEVQKREARTRRRYLEILQASACRRELESQAEERAEMSAALRECLGGLPEDSRALLAGRYESGIPVEDLARERGRTATALRVALFRIRQALRRCVEGKLGRGAALPGGQSP